MPSEPSVTRSSRVRLMPVAARTRTSPSSAPSARSSSVTAVIEVAVNLRAVPQASEGGFQAVLVAFVKLRKQACC